MIPYQAKSPKFSGTSYSEVMKRARQAFREIERRSRRKPYVRSAYFQKEKIFFDFFWQHLQEKSLPERKRRLKYFSCAVELIKESKQKPTSKLNPHRKGEVLHRFVGQTVEREIFFVQIKEEVKTGEKYLLSVFPLE